MLVNLEDRLEDLHLKEEEKIRYLAVEIPCYFFDCNRRRGRVSRGQASGFSLDEFFINESKSE